MAMQVILGAKLDTGAVDELRGQLLASKDCDIVLDGSGVQQLGGLCLELMMSARHLWAAAGKSLSLETPSDQLVDDLARFGLTPDALTGGTS